VWLYGAPLDAPAALDAVVDAALARRLSSVTLHRCRLSPASVPALARLLGGDTLSELHINNAFEQLLDEPAATLLANALRANTSLTALTLHTINLWHDAAAATEFMGALTGHPRLRVLDLSYNGQPRQGALQAAQVGAKLAALLLANAPALQTLIRFDMQLFDAGMRPVVEALRHNTYLTTLNCSNNRSEAFARNKLLPAVRANASLRKLRAGDEGAAAAVREAEALVAARTQPHF
jgi:Leucine-rich repeat (LRR) protein